jgi:uncharacterized OB-fold protein
MAIKNISDKLVHAGVQVHPQSLSHSLAQPYVDGLKHCLIRFQTCGACGRAQTLAHDACKHCGHEQLIWSDSAGRGVVHAVTVVGRAPSDDFRPLAPYTLVIVALDEGARVMGHATPDIKIGERVTASFFDHLGETLIKFQIASP